MNDKPIDVHYEDVNKKYYTIDEVSNVLEIDQSKIIFYFEKLNDFLNITSVGMYQLFDNTDIKNLQIIRDLELDKRMTIKDIKEYLSLTKQEILLKKESNNAVDKSILNVFQNFANALMEQNTKIDMMYKNNIHIVKSINILTKSQQQIEKDLQEQRVINKTQAEQFNSCNKQLSQQLSDVQQELSLTKEANQKQLESQSQQLQTNLDNMSNKIIEENTKALSESVNEFKCITLEQLKNQQPKSFIDRIFHLKK